MNRRKQNRVAQLKKWVGKEAMEPGELFTLSEGVSLTEVSNSWVAISPSTSKGIRSSGWVKNSYDNPFLAKIVERSKFYRTSQDEVIGLFVFQEYRIIGTSSSVVQLTSSTMRNALRTPKNGKKRKLAGLGCICALWTAHDRYVLLPVCVFTQETGDGKPQAEFISILPEDTFAAKRPLLENYSKPIVSPSLKESELSRTETP